MIDNNRFIESLKKVLVHDEGLRLVPYRDSLGFWTIGVGRYIGANIEKLRISEEIAYKMLEEDIATTWDDVCAIFSRDDIKKWNEPRAIAIFSLIFNLGRSKFSLFQKTIQEIKNENWEAVGQRLRGTLWARQVKNRSARIIHMIEKGEIHEAYNSFNNNIV